MSNTNTGGPAFPNEGGAGHLWNDKGMTLRDYFAAKAMQGLMGRVWGDLPAEELFTLWARGAYALADAMLEARK